MNGAEGDAKLPARTIQPKMPEKSSQIPGLLQQAVTHHRAGRVAEAERLYRRVLQADPDQPDALRLLAGLALQSGRHSLAESHARRALQRRPHSAELHWMLATALMERGRAAAAAQSAQQALQADDGFTPARLLLGNALFAGGDTAGAEQAWRDVLTRDVANAAAQFNLAQLLLKRGANAQARELLEKVVASAPGHAGALGLLGECLVAEDARRASGLLQRALELGNRSAAVHAACGRALFKINDWFAARAALEEAVRLEPRNTEALLDLGEVCDALEQPERAIELYQHALATRPQDHILRLKVSDLLDGLWRVGEGMAFARRMATDSAHFASNLCYFANLSDTLTPQQVFAIHRDWARRFADPLMSAPPAFANDRDPKRRLRLGYVSGDLRRHSVAIFFEPLLGAHDREAFEIFLYDNNRHKQDAVTERLRGFGDVWREVKDLDDRQLFDLVRRDGIDILVDLSGHTAMHRLEMFALKPAPVQITYLGAVATTGMQAMDYRLVDPNTDPPGLTESQHTEKLLRIEGGFLCFEPLPVAGDPAPPPSAAAGHVTFGSTNNLSKIGDRTIALWARVLQAVPDARLLVRDGRLDRPAVRQAFKERCAAHGIAGHRLEMRGRIAGDAEHLRAYGDIDILLDPFPYNGVTTTCEAAWMGVPTVTLEGDRSGARSGVAILRHMGVGELVARDADEYVNIASALAGDSGRLGALRGRLRALMQGSALCDRGRLARNIEQAYRQAWQHWCESA